MSPPHPTTPYEGREPSNADIVAMLTDQNRTLTRLEKNQAGQGERLEVVERALLGSIDPPRKGFLNRVRELEASHRAIKKIAWTALAALITFGVTWAATRMWGSAEKKPAMQEPEPAAMHLGL